MHGVYPRQQRGSMVQRIGLIYPGVGVVVQLIPGGDGPAATA